ncbi:g3343 [Coccomyxa elongata]
MFNVLLYCAHLSEASNVTVSKNFTLAGARTSIKQLGDQVFDAGLTVLNATYPRVPLLNQVLPELPPEVANSSIGVHAKAAVDAASALEKGVLTYRLPLLNETLPALPHLLANSSLGHFAQHIVDKASAKEAAIQDDIKPLPPVVANQTFNVSSMLPLAASLRTVNFTNFPNQSLPTVTFEDLQYTGWVPAVLADGQTYLAAAKSATAAPLYYSLMLPPDSQSTSFQLLSAVIVRSEDVLLTGYAADGRPPYTYVASGACDVTEDCTTGDLSTMAEWGDLSAVTFTAGGAPVDPLATSSQITTAGRRRLQQTEDTSGDANATADSAFFLIDPLYTENPNPISPYTNPDSLLVSPACSPGFYGEYCSQPDDCNGNGATNPSDGSCICFDPYTGQFCNVTIESSTIAQDTSTPAVQSSTPAIPTSTPTPSSTNLPLTTTVFESSTLPPGSTPAPSSTSAATTFLPTSLPPGTQMCMALPGGPVSLLYINPPEGEGVTFNQVFVADINPYGAIGQTFTIPVDVNVTTVALMGYGLVSFVTYIYEYDTTRPGPIGAPLFTSSVSAGSNGYTSFPVDPPLCAKANTTFEFWPSPNEWRPERFLEGGREALGPHHPNACLPFLAGNRSCIGRQFALLELQTLVAAVVRKVNLSAAGPLDVIQDMTLKARGGIWLQAAERSH